MQNLINFLQSCKMEREKSFCLYIDGLLPDLFLCIFNPTTYYGNTYVLQLCIPPCWRWELIEFPPSLQTLYSTLKLNGLHVKKSSVSMTFHSKKEFSQKLGKNKVKNKFQSRVPCSRLFADSLLSLYWVIAVSAESLLDFSVTLLSICWDHII